MSRIFPSIDPEGLLEFSVVFTDRSLNHMSQRFQSVMRDLNRTLTSVYNADVAVVVPGGGTYAMEAVARQLATDKKCLVLRNGFFSYRWSQIFEAGKIPSEAHVLKARPIDSGDCAAFAPAPIEEVEALISKERPELVFAPHVETASGIILPEDYLKRIAAAVHAVGGLFVLDCIASGAVWLDMDEVGADVLISAPQKGWSSTPCAGLVMLNKTAREKVAASQSSSFACDLRKWLEIMEAYLNGGHAYHATMPTDALAQLMDTMTLQENIGFDVLKQAQCQLGEKVRQLLRDNQFKSVAAKGFEAPGVVVSYVNQPSMTLVKQFLSLGLQTAAGVPLMCDEPESYQSFRIGLFGIDKLQNIDATLSHLEAAFSQL